MDDSPPTVHIIGDPDERLDLDPRPLRERAREAFEADVQDWHDHVSQQLAELRIKRLELLKLKVLEILGEIATITNQRVPIAEVDELLFTLGTINEDLQLVRYACSCDAAGPSVSSLTHLGRLLDSHDKVCRRHA